MKLSATCPISLLCAVLGLARSSFYYQAGSPDETVLEQAIETVAARFPTYGTRRITHQIRREEPRLLPLNRKRVQRVMREKKLLVKRKKRVPKTTNSQHAFPRYPNLVADLEITQPHQVWVSDITYIKLGGGTFVFLALILDVFTRAIRGWALSHGLGGELTRAALQQALSHGCPTIHHSDQGVQYAATDYVALLATKNIQISMAEVGQSQQNGYAERVIIAGDVIPGLRLSAITRTASSGSVRHAVACDPRQIAAPQKTHTVTGAVVLARRRTVRLQIGDRVIRTVVSVTGLRHERPAAFHIALIKVRQLRQSDDPAVVCGVTGARHITGLRAAVDRRRVGIVFTNDVGQSHRRGADRVFNRRPAASA